MSDKRLPVVFCWHMHQPDYRNHASGQFHEPWTYLHGIRDYADMAAHLENNPKAKAVVNFSPCLLEQLEDYCAQLQAYFQSGTAIRDSLLNSLVSPVMPADCESKALLIRKCQRANEVQLVQRFPPFQKLVSLGRMVMDNLHGVEYLSDHFLTDLVTWYHLAWLGESLHRDEEVVQTLIAKGSHFDTEDRHKLLKLIYKTLQGIIPRYRALLETGQVELAMNPWGHPILPLMDDFETAREAIEGIPLPLSSTYPDGLNRARWHLQAGKATFKRLFGQAPVGLWPSEGAISESSLKLAESEGFAWAASGENVLANSLKASEGEMHEGPHRAYSFDGSDLAVFFRDDGLSDAIGFNYSGWQSQDAVNDLMHHLSHIDQATQGLEGRVVSIIMDGENAWEYYPNNAWDFLSTLYAAFDKHPQLRLETFSEHLSEQAPKRHVDKLVAGSWVYGNLSTWIGHPDKNHAWDLLVEAKKHFDQQVAKGPVSEAAMQQMAICESSDWFWWFGDDNPAEAVNQFDQLYRLHLSNLYQFLGLQPPDSLGHVLSFGHGRPEAGGVMKRGSQ